MRLRYIVMLGAVLAAVPAAGAAQDDQHHIAGGESAGIAQCIQAQLLVNVTIEAATSRLEMSRQTNSPSAMRAAVDDFDRVLREVRAQLEPCRQMTLPPAGSVGGHVMPDSPAPAPAVVADAHAGHEMTTAANPAARLADLMCEPKVDPRTAPRATYNGKAYYFCSEADRDLFLKEPAKYLER